MPHELIFYVLVIIFAGSLSLFLSLYAHLNLKNAPGAKQYIAVTILSTIFTYSYVFELCSKSLEQIKFWLKIEYLAMPFIPVFILLMCLEYIGIRLKNWIYYILFIPPIVTIFMHDTNDLHHLYYKSFSLNSEIPFPIVKLEYGPFFYVHSIFLFLCLMISMIMLFVRLRKAAVFRFKIQIFMMIAGLIMPIAANHFYLNGLSPYGIDLGPVSMSISFLFHGSALLTFQMFNVAPIARDTVFESMKDGVIVLSQNNRVVDYNHAMKDVLPILNKHMIGKPIDDILCDHHYLFELIQKGQSCDCELLINSQNIHYNIRFAPVLNKNGITVGQILTFTNITERIYLLKKLKRLASIDGLTQIFNKSFFMNRYEEVYNELKAMGENIAVVMFDIDHFKNVNDTFGHEVGDIVLSSVAKLAKDHLRSSDLIGRYGGEEFVICLPNTNILEAYKMADHIREKIAEWKTNINDEEIQVTSSFGVTSTQFLIGDEIKTMQSLIREADQALYVAKNGGRDRVEMFEQVHEYSH
ncbi:histidine kinase N-terminal 7TM domain-containing diguanylate cyclase [Gottfriedia solisilvae]|uniref:GGDEF domain-containing protein n=1 Tax=Gottfriedia solisilvae TaxID=1516104 RepID=A0A8J3AU07_9BACI|nr:histidine kinase N-terminal 7TM domain-containing protein [Gottfriedia solisilvae]GGI16113.1 GGDEF domain-containing protein [Gottfriedia solisilvae]